MMFKNLLHQSELPESILPEFSDYYLFSHSKMNNPFCMNVKWPLDEEYLHFNVNLDTIGGIWEGMRENKQK